MGCDSVLIPLQPVAGAMRRMDFVRRLSVGVVLVHVCLLLYSGWVHSPNHLEANLLPAGYMHLKYGRFDNAQVNTPLSRTLCAIPLLFYEVQEDWGSLINEGGFRPEYPVGKEFVENNLDCLREMFFVGRAVASVFSIIGALAVHTLARRLHGETAALVAVVLWCFSPMVLGHGATVNHDVPGAAMLALALLLFVQFDDEPSLSRAFACGVVCGLALLTRTTTIAFIGLWLIYFIVRPSRVPPVDGKLRRIWLAAVIVFVMHFMLNLGYEFTGTMMRLGDYEFGSRALSGIAGNESAGNRFRGTIVENVPVPFPRDFVHGLDLQQKDFESPAFSSYLSGEWRANGWWYYYLFAWAIKTPIGFQLTLLLAVVTLLRDVFQRTVARHEILIFGSVALMFVLASMKSGFTIHYRYVLPSFPFVAILCSRIWHEGMRSASLKVLSTVLMAHGVLASLYFFPHSLSYFNEFVGGPKNGENYLLHSSCDWGQDMYLLQDWLGEHPDIIGNQLYVHCAGPLRPHMLGIEENRMPMRPASEGRHTQRTEEIEQGVYIISVSLLYAENSPYQYLKAFEPCRHIGYSIHVYDLRQDNADTW